MKPRILSGEKNEMTREGLGSQARVKTLLVVIGKALVAGKKRKMASAADSPSLVPEKNTKIRGGDVARPL